MGLFRDIGKFFNDEPINRALGNSPRALLA